MSKKSARRMLILIFWHLILVVGTVLMAGSFVPKPENYPSYTSAVEFAAGVIVALAACFFIQKFRAASGSQEEQAPAEKPSEPSRPT